MAKEKKKNKSIIVIIILYLLGIYGLTTSFSPFDGFGLLLSLVLLTIPTILIYFAIKRTKKTKEIEKSDNSVEKYRFNIFESDGTRDFNIFPSFQDEWAIRYVYETDICFIDKSNIKKVVGNAARQLTFETEEENPYDKNAIKILMDNECIGYVYKGLIQDMLNDWMNKDWEAAAYINKYSVEECKATYKIAFYKPFDIMNAEDFKLIGITQKCAEELEYISDGDKVEIEYVESSDTYVVNYCGDKIGKMPVKFRQFAEEKKMKQFAGTISDIEIDDKKSAIIHVYY